MPRATAKDPARTRAKHVAAIEAVNDNIRKLQDQLTQVEDLRQEGFPYRDAMRARAELQVRECIKCIFGERSPEFQQWKTYHLRTSSPSEVAETISLLQTLIAQLERKKLELQGIAPPVPSHVSTVRSAPAAPSPASPVAPAAPLASAAPAQIVPQQVGDHHQLRHFLRARLQFIGELGIGGCVQAARAGSFDWPRLDVVAADLEELLGRSGDQLEFAGIHIGHVGRGRNLEQNVLLRSGDVVVVP